MYVQAIHTLCSFLCVCIWTSIRPEWNSTSETGVFFIFADAS